MKIESGQSLMSKCSNVNKIGTIRNSKNIFVQYTEHENVY